MGIYQYFYEAGIGALKHRNHRGLKIKKFLLSFLNEEPRSMSIGAIHWEIDEKKSVIILRARRS